MLLTALGTILVTAGVLLLRKYFGAEGILILGIIGVAVFWGWVLRWLYTDGRITFSHVLVIWLMASGTVMGGASYYLALRGITDTLETLAHYVMVETVAGQRRISGQEYHGERHGPQKSAGSGRVNRHRPSQPARIRFLYKQFILL